jgi:hypothetical protein
MRSVLLDARKSAADMRSTQEVPALGGATGRLTSGWLTLLALMGIRRRQSGAVTRSADHRECLEVSHQHRSLGLDSRL